MHAPVTLRRSEVALAGLTGLAAFVIWVFLFWIGTIGVLPALQPLLMNGSLPWLGGLLCAGAFLLAAQILPPPPAQPAPSLPLTGWLGAILCTAVTGVIWGWFALGHDWLNLDVSLTCGDESWHDYVSVQFRDVIAGRRATPAEPRETLDFIRYPPLVYLVNAAMPWTQAGWLEPLAALRLTLALFLLPLSPLLAWGAGRLARAEALPRPVITWVMLVAAALPMGNGLLMSYSFEAYLDLPQAAFLLAASLCLLVGHAERNPRLIFMSLLLALLACLARDNVLPFALCLVVLSVSFLPRLLPFAPRLPLTGLLIAFGLGAPLSYSLAKSLAMPWDYARLSLSHVPVQDYAALAEHGLYHFGPVLLVGAALMLRHILKPGRWRLPLLALFASLGGVLLLYAMFHPFWMPWSRNYLMLWGSVAALTTLSLVRLRWRDGRAWAALGLVTPLWNAVMVVSAFGQQEPGLYHENEVRYPLREAAALIEATGVTQAAVNLHALTRASALAGLDLRSDPVHPGPVMSLAETAALADPLRDAVILMHYHKPPNPTFVGVTLCPSAPRASAAEAEGLGLVPLADLSGPLTDATGLSLYLRPGR